MTSGEQSRQCAHFRPLLGMAALGRVSDAEAMAARAHLDGCPSCTAELRMLRATAERLGRADPDRVAQDPPVPPARLGEAVLAGVAAARRRARRRAAAVGTGVLTGVAATVAGVLLLTSALDSPDRPRPQVAYSSGGTHATAYLTDHSWGVSLRLDVGGLPAGEHYLVWLERADGSRVPAGSFTALGERSVSVELTAGMRRQGAVALGLSTVPGGPPALRVPVTT
ncbi:zf-HC2 domain-containing protein [Embleya sp. NPDC056575]|uniref:zf-HC2 domain-containing protein n=1 Tax=unclassified Embleya TaxID=2699296 RepID=UPI00369CE08D